MAALNFLKRTMKRYGRPKSIVTDRLRTYGAAMKALGIVERQGVRVPDQQSGREFTSTVPATRECHGEVQRRKDLAEIRRDIFKQNNSAAMAEWRQLAA